MDPAAPVNITISVQGEEGDKGSERHPEDPVRQDSIDPERQHLARDLPPVHHPIQHPLQEEPVPGPSSPHSSADSLLFAADGSSYYDEDLDLEPETSGISVPTLGVPEDNVRFSMSQPVTPVTEALRESVVLAQPQGRACVMAIPGRDMRTTSAPEIRQPPKLGRDSAMPFNLRLLLKLNMLSLSSEWISDTHTRGTYRYLHYKAYGANKKKQLEGDIECCFDSCLGCCLSCVATEVTVHVRSAAGSDLFRIQLTGMLGKEPLDTADIVTADGNVIAHISWKSPYFEVEDVQGKPLLKMKLQRFLVCTLNMTHKVLDAQTCEVLGTIEAIFTLFGPSWSSGYTLITNIQPKLDLKRRLAWIALMFVLKLTHRGREYAKVIRVD